MVGISKNEQDFLAKRDINIKDVSFICEVFNMGELKNIHSHFEKSVNINQVIQTDKGYFVCKFFYAETKRIKEIIRIMKLLHESNVPVLLPLQDGRGEYFTRLKDYSVQVTPLIEGISFNYCPNQLLFNGKTLRKIHDTLEKIHGISNPIASIYPSEEVLLEGLEALRVIKNRFTNDNVTKIFKLHDKITRLWDEKSNSLPFTIIHGDWNERNLIYTHEGIVCCVFDFEFVQRRERLFDIANMLWILLTDNNYTLAKEFMKGYGYLTDREKDILPLAIARNSFFFICTASLSKNPIYEVNHQLQEQLPFIKFTLSQEGVAEIRKLLDL